MLGSTAKTCGKHGGQLIGILKDIHLIRKLRRGKHTYCRKDLMGERAKVGVEWDRKGGNQPDSQFLGEVPRASGQAPPCHHRRRCKSLPLVAVFVLADAWPLARGISHGLSLEDGKGNTARSRRSNASPATNRRGRADWVHRILGMPGPAEPLNGKKSMIATLNINMDHQCKECGKAGATDSGICLNCGRKAMDPKHRMKSLAGKIVQSRWNKSFKEDVGMHGDIAIKLTDQAATLIAGLLAEHRHRIFGDGGAFETAHKTSLEEDANKKFSYPISLRLVVTPTAEMYEIDATIGYNVKTKETASALIRTEPDMADMGIAAAKKERVAR